MDKIMTIMSISNLKIETFLGVYEWEQAIKQYIYIDLDYAINITPVLKGDSLENVLDYDQVGQQLNEFVEAQKSGLLETLVCKIADFLQETYQFSWFKIKVTKPLAIKNAQGVSIVLEKRRLG